MKKIYNILLGLFVVAFYSCDPIEDRDTLKNSFNPDEIELTVEHSSPGSNLFTLKMNTVGVAGYWDHMTGITYSDEVEVLFPIAGEFTFTYYVSTPYMPEGDPGNIEYLSKTITVNIDKIDVPQPDAFYKLAGTTLEGKTWVFAGTPFDNTLWWYMTPYDNPQGMWWNAGGECCPPADKNFVQDAAAEINFNLFKEYTYTLNDNVTDGMTWRFNADYTELTISDHTMIPGYQNEWGEPKANPEGKYQVIELTDDKLMLWTGETITGDSGWAWVFKPKTE